VSQNLVELDNVSFGYDRGHPVLRDLSLGIEKNSLVIIRGESGAGKSTLLKLLNRFYDPDSGSVFFRGRQLIECGIYEARSSIIYLPQLPVMTERTVEDNLSFPFSFHAHKGKTFDSRKAREWLEYFQLDLPLDHDTLKLSVGQKQRIALIRAMLLEPEVLLLDEPGSALDSNNKRLIEQKVESLISSAKITVLMATHSDIGFSKDIYRIFNLEGGRLAECKAE
jgi:putative ABC transport system ATP-binding protein